VYVTDGSEGNFQPGTTLIYVENAASIAERAMLVDLVDGFKNATYNATGGDVYMDFSNVMNNDLAGNLSANGALKNYTVLLVGSNVDQNAMTSGAAMDAVRNFTLAGGLLIVLGSPAQQAAWLGPLFTASLSTASGGVGTPDATNPILHAPEELAYGTYNDIGVSWALGNPDAAHFTHVLTRGGANPVLDQLALSLPGAFGNGSIVLSTWQPWNLTKPQDKTEAERVLYNFLSQANIGLYVDFGPQVPSFADVASSSRLATAPSPLVPGQNALVRVVLYVFK
jgi:hypothetical protein